MRTDHALEAALLHLQQLQFENDAGAANDLLPAQTALHELLNPGCLQRGLVRRWIETDPEVALLRNRADRWDPPPDAEDVFRLMHCRNIAAQKLGYASYPQAILSADGMTQTKLRSALETFLQRHLPAAAKAVRRAGISAMAQWYPLLTAHCRLDTPGDPLQLLQAFADRLGFGSVLERTEVRLVPEGSCFAARTGDASFSMQVVPMNTLYGWRTLFHEFGHLCTYASLPRGALPWLSSVADEMIAVLFEHAAVHLLADDMLRSRLLQDMQLDYTRTAISALFELELWQQPENAEALYRHWYGQLVSAPDVSAWSRDSFRSIDCMTIHSYALGQMLAEAASPSTWMFRLQSICAQAASLTIPQLEKRIHAKDPDHPQG